MVSRAVRIRRAAVSAPTVSPVPKRQVYVELALAALVLVVTAVYGHFLWSMPGC